MLYLVKSTQPQVLMIPRNTDVSGDISLRLRSTVDLTTELFPSVLDLKTSSLYYNMSVALPEGAAEGEYYYSVMQGGDEVATGILIVGMEFDKPAQYEKTIEYEQYAE